MMHYFDFHHHNIKYTPGIYNLSHGQLPENGLIYSAGLHPYDISDHWRSDFEEIKRIAASEQCWAVGECGLDATIPAEETLQHEILKAHISLANDLKKPVILHCVRKFDQLLKFRKYSHVPLVIHGYNKGRTLGKTLAEKGFFLSFGKALLQNVSLQELFTELPAEKIFLETDTSEEDIAQIYEKAGELKNMSVENLSERIEENLKTILNG